MADDIFTQETVDKLNASALTFNEVVTSRAGGVASGAVIDQTLTPLGETTDTLKGRLDKLGVHISDWASTDGGTLTSPAQAFLNNTSGSTGFRNYYSWSGAFPKTVAPGTDPAAVGSGYTPRTDVVLRDALAESNAVSAGLVGGLVYHAIAGDISDFYAKVKLANDNGGGTVVWPAATISTDNAIKIGNNIGDSSGYFGVNSISNVTIHAEGVKVIPATAGSSVNLGELVVLIDATDCTVYGFSTDAAINTNASSRGGIRMAGCVRCDWYYPEVKNARNYSLIVSGSQFGIGTRDGAHNNIYFPKVTDQQVWTPNSAAQIIAANGARFTTFHSGYSANLIGTGGIDLYDDDNAPYTKFVDCVAIGTSSTGAGFWLEGTEEAAPSYRIRCVAIGMSTAFGTSQSRWANDTDCISIGITGRALWSRSPLDKFTGCKFIDGGTIDIEMGAELVGCTQELINSSSLPVVNVYNGGGDNDGVARFVGGSYGDIVVNNTGCRSIELIGADVKSIKTYNSSHRKITQLGGRCRSPSLINRGTWFARDVDFELIQGELFPVMATIDSANVELIRCKFKSLAGGIYSGSGFSRLKIRESVLTNCPDAINTNEVKLTGTTGATCRELRQQLGLININVHERDNSGGFPSLSMIMAANSSTDTRASNILLSKAGTSGGVLTCTWATNGYPVISKSSAEHDGIYVVID